ncbi:SDR family NAD(P)-dependent oxidoreductase [Draconibacterium halophilum]|uniref:SDR family NAD(P)-dependent oxidoreductase n=1 Tax=Draconibacterium halophilum TaxID=2706887 RepID=A0A6C0RDR2_9BACT|nr:SDR family NAD(P)-dependent oxidoreductase [Draconibacterium halophilum]QIA07643.1 SDR family NAD(P)-dependent oxidoreductase [Draconibacterium halophilum]
MEGLKNLIKISQFYGQNPEMVIAGGGNTSYKNDENIWVKASGFALATITEDGFAKLDRKKLGLISEKTYSADSFERERQIKDDLMEATITKDRRPSVEISMHDVIDFAYVVHLHPTKVNGLMCGNQVEKYLDELFGDQVVYIPYIDPGYVLFKGVEKQLDKFKAKNGKTAQIIFLQNHGIFVAADSIDEIETIYSDVFAKLNGALKEELSEEALPIREDVAEFVPAIRMMVSEVEIKTLRLRNNAVIAQFTKDAQAYEKVTKPFTPDLIVYCKSKYIFIENTENVEDLLKEAKEKIEAFISTNGFAPKVILLKGIGLLAVGDHAVQCDTILDVYEDAMKISAYSESFGGQHFMTPEQIAFIDTWEVENYRRKIAAGTSVGRVQNKTIIVTGAAMGFGEGIALHLTEEGANIVVADINEEVGQKTAAELAAMKGNNRAIFVKTNVADMESLANLMKETVATFGGLDVFVSNAGVLRAGGLDEMTPENFEFVTKINYNAYFYCTKVASKILKLQNAYKPDYYSDIIQINSKSGLKGSKKNFAYAGGKFGGIGLTQSFALELAPDKIKVNSVCPGNFYEGPLWSDPENGLFIQYLNAGKVPGAKTIDDVKQFYLDQVPLGKGCSPKDVVKGILYLIDQENETGQALPISGGQSMLH